MECAICLEPIRSETCDLKCGHVFHSSCVLQSAVHDPRCPICRTELATKPASHVVNVELSIGDVNQVVEDEIQQVRREQVNYDARRRRFLRRRPELLRAAEAAKRDHTELRALERRIEAQWSRESNALWRGPSFEPIKRERSLLLRRLRRSERLVDVAVVEELGERPEIDEGESVFRAIASMGRERAGRE